MESDPDHAGFPSPAHGAQLCVDVRPAQEAGLGQGKAEAVVTMSNRNYADEAAGNSGE